MSTKTFTLADLADHKTKKSLYLAIEGKVYNCTEFIDEVCCVIQFLDPDQTPIVPVIVTVYSSSYSSYWMLTKGT
jgi:hypothetical protein